MSYCMCGNFTGWFNACILLFDSLHTQGLQQQNFGVLKYVQCGHMSDPSWCDWLHSQHIVEYRVRIIFAAFCLKMPLRLSVGLSSSSLSSQIIFKRWLMCRINFVFPHKYSNLCLGLIGACLFCLHFLTDKLSALCTILSSKAINPCWKHGPYYNNTWVRIILRIWKKKSKKNQ